ncbi:Retrovirus-related Pol polyprotein from type-1 retrotransposable element R2 [Stylophora pistillata]|uniref:Retrovirus-related Pol polyprotein from type-1 retrotransposable element R2 n=1 Tax=Stylophora pistillata TaxID=50429 RepID=A0A2B4R3T7_STYPI|nr:Retrovirus-related Pol polyprotein from type-1 retrotransposable element R2 [Stylophora pistillata]
MVENGARHPLASTDQLYIPRSSGGRGLKSVESEYKLIKIKAAVKLCANTDPTLKLVREFEERAVDKGRRSMLKDASGFARELGIELELEHPEPVGRTEEGELVDKKKIGVFAKKALYTKRRQGIEEQRWQGKLVANRWQDDQLDRSCFSLLCEWRTAPTYTIAALEELYQQLLPTKVYSTRKAKTSGDSDVRCRLCGKGQESVAHVLAGCSALAQTAYLTRHNAAFKILFFELLRDHGLVNTVPPWYSPTQPKPIYEGEKVTAYWDVPVFADQTEVRANRIDGRIVDKARKTVTLLEMSCPWDSQRGRRNLSMAWVDVRKAYDSVDHKWLKEMFALHRFPTWIGNLIARLCGRWNTKITAVTKQGVETSERIAFRKGLPQGDALCPRLFTLCLNPIAWKLKASEGYRLSKPISAKITDLLYIDDLKIYAASEAKLERIMKGVRNAMEDVGLQWNERKCAVVHVRRGRLQEPEENGIGAGEAITSLREDAQYKFLGVLENVKQQDGLVLEQAEKEYLKRLSVVWSSPLSDYYKVLATNQFALPVMSYFMWTQVWPIADLQRIDRETRKIMVENGARHPLASTDQLYIPRSSGGRGLKSVESEYKLIKIKAAVKLCANTDPTLKLVREFEERAVDKGRRSMLKDASGFARELGIELELEHPEPVGRTEEGELVDKKKIGVFAKKALYTKRRQGIEEQRWQGKLVANRWQDDQLDRSCFSLLCEWRTAPTYTIAALEELYQQLLPTKVYSTRKAKTSGDSDVRCRLCGKGQESVAHVLAGCSALAQTAYLTRHNAAFKILFFELLRDHGLVNTVPPWYSPTQPKPIYEGEKVTAYWDVPVFADQTEVRANRIDGRIVDKARKTVTLLEMSCPWVDNRDHKDEEKIMKYAPLRLELKRQYPGFNIIQYNIIIDVLGGYSKDHKQSVRELVGSEKSTAVLGRMQKFVVSSSFKIARSLKVMS